MKDIPIIFSPPMVRAILDNRKTVTRRLAKQGNYIHAYTIVEKARD